MNKKLMFGLIGTAVAGVAGAAIYWATKKKNKETVASETTVVNETAETTTA